MDKYLGMVGDRLEVGDGDPTPLEKYRPAGGYGEAGSGVDVAQVQYRPSGAMQGNTGQGDQTTPEDALTNKINEEGCKKHLQ